MKTIRRCLAIAAFAAAHVTLAQDWARLPGGDVITTNEWMGADVGSLIPLSFETRVNQPMLYSTNSAQRMRLSETLTGQTVNGFTGLDLSGFLGVGDFSASPTIYRFPAARVHAENSSTLENGYRPMIGEGFLATRGESLCYSGLLNGLTSGTVWSTFSNGTSPPPATYRFIYTGWDGTATVSSSATGLELGRFEPDASLNEGYFGVGDYFTAGLGPVERLEVLDQTIRLRIFMVPTPVGLTSYESTTLTNVVVVDPSDGRLYWRTLNPWGGGLCDWNVTGLNNDVVTAYGGNPCPPQDAANVGIGNPAPVAKLDVTKTITLNPSSSTGVGLRMNTTSLVNYGFLSEVYGSAQLYNYGGHFRASNGGVSCGVKGIGAGMSTNIGLQGEALQSGAIINYGLYSRAANGSQNWAAWIDGRGFLGAPAWVYSDSAFKVNVQPLDSAMHVLMQVETKTYEHDTAAFSFLHLETGLQRGVLAQDLESVLPELVTDATRAAVLDSTGAILEPEVTFKAVNYDGFIPLLIAGAQEQHIRIEQLEAAVDQLLAIISACCAIDDQGIRSIIAPSEGSAVGKSEEKQTAGSQARLSVRPNPVTELAFIDYELIADGHVRLVVTNVDGRQLEVLHDGWLEHGRHAIQWNTATLAAGTYGIMLLLDGAPLVQRAVKIE